MSRRDTVIIAVLVNAVLLTMLFMLAANVEDEKIFQQTPSTTNIVDNQHLNTTETTVVSLPGTPINLATNKSTTDELDLMLKDLAMKTQMAEGQENNAANSIETTTLVEVQPQEIPTQSIPAASTTISAKDREFVEVTVKHGDYLEKIARENGTTISAIKKTNNLKSERINVGQVLKVPLSTRKKIVSEETTAAVIETLSKDPQYYTILSGDNPWKIAKKFKVKFEELLKLNNLDEEKARNLKPGDKIRVR